MVHLSIFVLLVINQAIGIPNYPANFYQGNGAPAYPHNSHQGNAVPVYHGNSNHPEGAPYYTSSPYQGNVAPQYPSDPYQDNGAPHYPSNSRQSYGGPQYPSNKYTSHVPQQYSPNSDQQHGSPYYPSNSFQSDGASQYPSYSQPNRAPTYPSNSYQSRGSPYYPSNEYQSYGAPQYPSNSYQSNRAPSYPSNSHRYYDGSIYQEEREAADFIKRVQKPLNDVCYKQVDAEFSYTMDMKKETSDALMAATRESTEVRKKIQLEMIERFQNWKQYKNEDIRYQVKLMLQSGPANMSTERIQKMVRLQGEIAKLRASAKMCDFRKKNNCSLGLDASLHKKFKKAALRNNMAGAEHYWTEAHNAVGKAIPPEMFEQFVILSNNLAQANDYENTMALWLSQFDDHSEGWNIEAFENELQRILDDFMPYYQKIHAYVRMRLQQSRGDSLKMPENGYMYTHIFGSLDEIGSDWSLLAEETMPFPHPNKEALNFDEALEEADYTPIKIIEAAENFFHSLNEEWKLPESVWKYSLFERPADKNKSVSCHPVAYDFCKKNHFRVHMCVTVSEYNLKLAYHELGHIFYYLEYQDLPIAYRNGANPGFHEAIGDTIALSITPKHLKCILGIDMEVYDHINCSDPTHADEHEIDKTDINVLYTSALTKLPILPFSLAIDFWRTKVFNGEIGPKDYNREYWRLREELQGLVPPSPRPADNLDAMVLFHTAANIPYIIYFTSLAFQFQFYEAMCIKAGQYHPYDPEHVSVSPLHRCDFANSKEAGKLLKDVLSQGASRSWKSILEQFTGSREISLRPLIHYYQPLFDFMDNELRRNNFPACFGKYCNQNHGGSRGTYDGGRGK